MMHLLSIDSEAGNVESVKLETSPADRQKRLKAHLKRLKGVLEAELLSLAELNGSGKAEWLSNFKYLKLLKYSEPNLTRSRV